jgi:CubicO group peptidase (beta-lactamase class C family)
MKALKKIAIIIVVLLIGTLAAGSVFVKDIAQVGNGFKAKIICSGVFVSGRTQAEIEDVDLLATKSYPITARVDKDKKEVTAKLLGLFKKRAVYREGLGCTVVVDTTDEKLKALADAVPPVSPPLHKDIEWPLGENVDTYITPESVDPEKLSEAMEFAFTDLSPDKKVGTRAIVVVYKGKIIAERYAPGFDKDSPLLGWSMTKSVTNALVGILVRDGKLDISKPAPVPEWKDPADPRSKITLDQLLRMSSGLKFVEKYEDNITSDCNMMLFAEPDMAAFSAGQPLLHEPDSHWSYSSGTSNIISRIVRHTVPGGDKGYYEFPVRELFSKLGMSSAVMEPDSSGTFVGSSYMYATGRDWARFGLLFLQDGVWQGERILPEGWVAYCITPTPKAPKGEYGAQWWLNAGEPDNPEDRWMPKLPTDIYSARGHDGQYVTVIPSFDMVVVRLGFTPSHLKAWRHEEFILKVKEAVSAFPY